VRRAHAFALLTCLTLLAACGSKDEETPAACLSDSSTYLRALRAAPGEVLLRDETAISACLVPNQPAGELVQLGAPLVEAATVLNARSHLTPQGPAPIRLGYLVGAVERGATETGGVHAELLRRIETAATYSRPGGGYPFTAFERRYEKGYAAGLDSG
jgi:hypothetical protein